MRTVSAVIVNAHPLARLAANTTPACLGRSIASHDSFEPLLATASFGVWINLFRVMDSTCVWDAFRLEPRRSAARVQQQHSTRKLFLLDVSWDKSSQSQSQSTRQSRRGAFALPRVEATTTTAAVLYLGVLCAFDCLYPRRTRQPYFLAANPSMTQLLVQVATALLAYDFCFCFIHFTMHRSAVVARVTQHAAHHR
jgi:hypothetical protein